MEQLTDYQKGKLIHAFGLDYSNKPYRNYYHCNKENEEWEDMQEKGYAGKFIDGNSIIYFGTHKALKLVFRNNVTFKYWNSI